MDDNDSISIDDSILSTIKDMVGIAKEDDSFDNDLIININSALSVLWQIGMPFAGSYSIKNNSDTWGSMFEGNEPLIDMSKEYMYMRVRIVFDPPSNSYVMDSIKNRISELEWRIRIQLEGVFDIETDSKPDE